MTAFDGYALIVTVIGMIPLNSMGVGAAVTSAYAEDGPLSGRAVQVMRTALRVLTVSTLVIAAVAVLIGGLGGWPHLLGAASGPNVWCTAAVVVYALGFVPGLGYSALLGVHRNHIAILVQTCYPPLILVLVGVVIASGASGALVLCAAPAAMVLTNLLMCGFAGRTARVPWFTLLRQVPRRRAYPGVSTLAISGPMLVTTLVTPIALQCDRIVLSHVSTEQALANYSVLLQIIAPALALIAASSQPLWPIYASARSRNEAGPPLSRILLLFCGGAVLAGAVLAAVADPIGHLIGDSQIDLGVALPVAGGLFVVVSAAAYPLAMYLMDPYGVRFVAICSATALPVNVVLTIVLAQHIGAAGPLVASIAVGALLQTAPALLYVRLRRPPGRHRAPARRIGRRPVACEA